MRGGEGSLRQVRKRLAARMPGGSSSGASAAGGALSLPGKGRGSPVEVFFFATRRRKGAEISASRGNLRVSPESQGQKRLIFSSSIPGRAALRCCAGFSPPLLPPAGPGPLRGSLPPPSWEHRSRSAAGFASAPRAVSSPGSGHGSAPRWSGCAVAALPVKAQSGWETPR